jgi:hypothetical protein
VTVKCCASSRRRASTSPTRSRARADAMTSPRPPCAGWRGPCPHGAIASKHACLPSTVARRVGEPWRCAACSRRRVGELRRGPGHWTANKTHCPAGHAYAGQNLITWTDASGCTRRYCRTCRNARQRSHKAEPHAARRCA